MVISKLINNNYVVATNDKGEEVIVKGLGVGFKKRAGSVIPKEQIEKIYRINNVKAIGELAGLLKDIPEEQFQVCYKIIDFAKQKLKTELNPNLYVTLTDHVNYAIFRLSKGVQVPNPMLNEIKSFYPKEYEIAQYALHEIQKKLGVTFGEEEAGFIAFHFVNAEANVQMNATMEITKLVKTAIQIIEQYFDMKMDESSIDYRRLVTHLQFIANNVIRNSHERTTVDAFNQFIGQAYPEEMACSENIVAYIKSQFQYEMDEDEISYLVVNISRVRKRKAVDS